MAARLGASSVLAVEQSKDVAALARSVIEDNRLGVSAGGPIKLLHGMSSDIELRDEADGADPHGRKATVVVSELVGTLLLGEMQVEFLEDARAHLLAPGAVMIPAGGVQYVTLIQSYDLENLTSVGSWRDMDLSSFNVLRDTDTMHKSKGLGVRLADTDFVELVEPISVLDVDFYAATIKDLLPSNASTAHTFTVRATRSGTIHAAVAYFDLFVDKGRGHVVSTNPRNTSFVRDMQWGQGIQAIEDWRLVQEDVAAGRDAALRRPRALVVEEGDRLKVDVYYAPGRGRHMQLRVSSQPEEASMPCASEKDTVEAP